MCELGAEVDVIRNDQITISDIETMSPEKIVISPGPKTPEKAPSGGKSDKNEFFEVSEAN